MVKSGEATGKLSDTFEYLADYLEKEYNSRSKIIGAMIYPAVIFVVFGIVFAIIVGYVIPQLTAVLTETGQDLPWITKIVIKVSDFFRTKSWVFFIVVFVVMIAIARAWRTKKGRLFFDRNLLYTPVLGSFLKKFYLTRFALNLSTLITGGLPIIQSLEITGEVVGNSVYQEIIHKTRDEVRKGEAIASVLGTYPYYISPLFLQMVIVGEKTGTLESSLKNVVNFYEKEVERAIETFIRLIEPAFIVTFGLVVAGLVAAVLMPIYSTMGNM